MATAHTSDCNTTGSYVIDKGHCIEESSGNHVLQERSNSDADNVTYSCNGIRSSESPDPQQRDGDAAEIERMESVPFKTQETVCSDKSITTTSALASYSEEGANGAALITHPIPEISVTDGANYDEPSGEFDDSDVGDEDFDAVVQDFQPDTSVQEDFASYVAAIGRDDSLVQIYSGGQENVPDDLYLIEDGEDFTIKTKLPSPQFPDKNFPGELPDPSNKLHLLIDEVGSNLNTLSVLDVKEVCDGSTAELKDDKEGSLEEEDSLYFEYLSDDAVSAASKISTADLNVLGGNSMTAANGDDKVLPSHSDSIPSDEEDFYDALDHQVEKEFDVALPHSKDKHHRRTGSDLSMESYANDLSSESESEGSVNEARVYTTKANSPKKGLQRQGSGRRDHKRTGSQDKIRMSRSLPDSQNAEGSLVPRRQRRKWIPEKPNISLNLWSVMKNCIGKELSKIPMPVNFNEPLSMLQRLTEELEYSEILDQAALCEDSCEQLAYVAAFTVSAYATTLFRTGKPFNPLLGETFEFDRTEDFGWKSLAEQVSHHPPTLATHTDGRGWTLWQEFTMTTKFRGRYLQIIPMGIAHLTFTKSGGHYTWRKVTTTVHNIIVGRLWVDNQGEMDITNHITGDRCHLKYSAYSYFSRETPRKVTGVVTDSKDNARWVLTGNWCTKMEGAPIIHVEESNKGKPVFETGPHKLLWKVRPPPNGAERIYFFSQLAIEMNEPEEGVAPTDSRNRPDQRLMEEGKWDEANHMKILLEEKQRAARRQREQEIEKAKNEDFDGEYQVDSIRKVTSSSQIDIPFPEGREIKPYHPTWFKKEIDSITGNLMHVFTHKYWDSKIKQQWDMCPDIFL
ncbi:oxysterol-binding protein 1-like isoform X2 [Pomacea canaliculata]|uniref:oxysterol-binding protein 1-like isoform X2 n=1 Tax=Pomacea canaliculata TaxID=400727 RepID=UPI000D735E57|nr:oxysterol-binding protein 1-like isoform X2 [Pomacea canaliculata]